MDDYDRLVLALGVLNREEDAHKVLADLLEEQGDRGGAQWARARKSGGKRRLQFVIQMLPHETALKLGCDLVLEWLQPDPLRRVLPIRDARKLTARVTLAIQIIEQWRKAERADEEVFDVCCWLRGLDDLEERVRDPLADAAQACMNTRQAEASGDRRTARIQSDSARMAVRRLAKFLPLRQDHMHIRVRKMLEEMIDTAGMSHLT